VAVEYSRIRILQINSAFSRGGVDNATIELVRTLGELGADVTFAVPAGSRLEQKAYNLPGVTSVSLRGGKVSWIQSLTEIIRSRGIEIVHAHHGRDYWPSIIAARNAGGAARIVTTRHLMTVPSWATRNFLLRLTDIVAVSKAARTVLDDHLEGPRGRLHQIYPGIDTALFRPRKDADVEKLREQLGWRPDSIGFGLASDFGPPDGKGHLIFLQAAARIHHELPKARFVMVGPDTQQPLLLETIRALKLEDVARILRFTEKMSTVMNALNVLVHPAVGTEALGLVILEAMACGKPVIASDLDGIPETFIDQQHGLLIAPGDVDALARAMKRLGDCSETRGIYGGAGREFVEDRFDRHLNARKSCELYSSILERRNGR
jgi:glycosyltransferase involved in cell wall biosynthesis